MQFDLLNDLFKVKKLFVFLYLVILMYSIKQQKLYLLLCYL